MQPAYNLPTPLTQPAQQIQVPQRKRKMNAECFFIVSTVANYQQNITNYLQGNYIEIFNALKLYENQNCKNFQPLSCHVIFNQDGGNQCQFIMFNEDVHSTRKESSEYQQISLTVELEIIQDIPAFQHHNYDLQLLDEQGFSCLSAKDTSVFITIPKCPVYSQATHKPAVMALPPTAQEIAYEKEVKDNQLKRLSKERRQEKNEKIYKEGCCLLKTSLCCLGCLTCANICGNASCWN